MTASLRPTLIWTGLWLVIVGLALWVRPALPVDETRYLAVAWEMWLRGDFLVPHLNGGPYSDKPPLLFWLFQVGWAVSGVNDWWPPVVAPSFGLAALFLTAALARRLWPSQPKIAGAAPLILLGCVFWTLFTTLTMFDMLLACFTLIGLIGLLDAAQGRPIRGWLLFGLAIGFGLLAKGPAILLHTLPTALLAPWWIGATADTSPRRWAGWFLGILAAVAGGAVLALLWAVPAALSGGEAYRNAIFWGQTAGRMVDSFAHGRPVWWYLAVTPGLMMPLLLWPGAWRAFKSFAALGGDPGLRFCISWFVPVFLAFSMISGKQLHYLLPIFPALALAVARAAFAEESSPQRRRDHVPPALTCAAIGAGLFYISSQPLGIFPETWLGKLQPLWGLALAALALILGFTRISGRTRHLEIIAGLTAATVVVIHLTARPILNENFNLKPLALRLAGWEAAGNPIAHYGKYHGQFHFLGRLEKPFAIIGDQEARDWVAHHPTGKIVTYRRTLPAGAAPEAVQSFRGRIITVWDAAKVGTNLDWVKRN
jgi:4-amino-4-deoxy-L-arabinose transferase-like glycosyltransferase